MLSYRFIGGVVFVGVATWFMGAIGTFCTTGSIFLCFIMDKYLKEEALGRDELPTVDRKRGLRS